MLCKEARARQNVKATFINIAQSKQTNQQRERKKTYQISISLAQKKIDKQTSQTFDYSNQLTSSSAI